MTTRSIASVMLVAACAAAVPAHPDDLALLLDGVSEIAAPGVPGPLCVFGERAFPVVVGGSGKGLREPVVAAARAGRGRLVAFGHTGYLDPASLATADTGRLLLNAVRWAARNKDGQDERPRVAVRKLGGLARFLRERGVRAEALNGAGWLEQLDAFDVLCCGTHALADDEIAEVRKFLRGGGGFITAGLGWGWLQLHPAQTLQQHPGNRLLATSGIVWADGYLQRTSGEGYTAAEPPSELCHAARALQALTCAAKAQWQGGQQAAAQALWTISHAVRALPPEDKLLRPRLRSLRRQQRDKLIPTAENPITMKQPLKRLLLTLELEELKRLPPERVRAHPAADSFPGPVPADAPRVSRKVEVDTDVRGWHSTGLYAAAGEVLRVNVPASAAGKGLFVRIGAHSDRLWNKDAWKRCPDICRRFAREKPLTRAANAFGGPVYIEVPKRCELGTIEVEIRNAVEAPYYVRGTTGVEEWRAKIRRRPAPWAELASSRIILTVPSDTVRALDDPESLMRFWVDVADACAALAARPLERRRPQRYVTDRQISAGYMHAGYPIMTHLDAAKVLVDKQRLTSNAHGGVWGLFHELGHNHQSTDWTFAGTGEVTENLFTLYVFDTVCGMWEDSRPSLFGQARAKTIREYLDGGRDFAQWKRDPFLALLMYIQVREAFGWDAYKQVFAEYRDLPENQRPQNDDEKRDQWLVRLSRTVGRNLGPFFEAWGVPTSDKARASIRDLPVWMPDDFPPK